MAWFSSDGKKMLVTKFFRTLAFGYLSVALPFYIEKILRYDAFLVGTVSTVALIGGVLFTILSGFIADSYGRKPVLILFGFLIIIAGLTLGISTYLSLIFIAVFIGSIGVNATETGPFVSIEQAMMPQTTSERNRTYAFSVYNFLGYAGASLGALLASLPDLLNSVFRLELIDGYHILFLFYAATGVLLVVLYRSLSPKAEVEVTEKKVLRLQKSGRTVAKLSALFSVDAFGGGFVITTVLTAWFIARFGTPQTAASGVFFVAQLITAASFAIAGWLPKKIGLLNTMVFTHLPSNILLISVGFAPDFTTAIALLFARQTLSQMDVPARQSYLAAIVPPEERNAATSITNTARSVAAAVPPAISGYLIAAVSTGAPLFLGGAFKIVYDIAIYASFRRVKAPEEVSAESQKRKGK